MSNTINELAQGPKAGWRNCQIFSWAAFNSRVGADAWFTAFGTQTKRFAMPIFRSASRPRAIKKACKPRLDDEPGFTLGSLAAAPRKPWVCSRAKSRDPFAKPLIQPNYLSMKKTGVCFLRGSKLSRRLMNTEALAPYFDYEGYPGAHIQNDDELLDVARQRSTHVYHLMGTCRMGTAD